MRREALSKIADSLGARARGDGGLWACGLVGHVVGRRPWSARVLGLRLWPRVGRRRRGVGLLAARRGRRDGSKGLGVQQGLSVQGRDFGRPGFLQAPEGLGPRHACLLQPLLGFPLGRLGLVEALDGLLLRPLGLLQVLARFLEPGIGLGLGRVDQEKGLVDGGVDLGRVLHHLLNSVLERPDLRLDRFRRCSLERIRLVVDPGRGSALVQPDDHLFRRGGRLDIARPGLGARLGALDLGPGRCHRPRGDDGRRIVLRGGVAKWVGVFLGMHGGGFLSRLGDRNGGNLGFGRWFHRRLRFEWGRRRGSVFDRRRSPLADLGLASAEPRLIQPDARPLEQGQRPSQDAGFLVHRGHRLRVLRTVAIMDARFEGRGACVSWPWTFDR